MSIRSLSWIPSTRNDVLEQGDSSPSAPRLQISTQFVRVRRLTPPCITFNTDRLVWYIIGGGRWLAIKKVNRSGANNSSRRSLGLSSPRLLRGTSQIRYFCSSLDYEYRGEPLEIGVSSVYARRDDRVQAILSNGTKKREGSRLWCFLLFFSRKFSPFEERDVERREIFTRFTTIFDRPRALLVWWNLANRGNRGENEIYGNTWFELILLVDRLINTLSWR